MKTTHTTRESGFTLLELLLVIGVAALLLIGGIATYRLVSDGNKATESTRMLLTIRQEAQTMAQQQGGNYDGIVFDSTTDSSTSPLVTGGTLRNNQRNPFNGAIIITPINGPAFDQLQIEFQNVSQSGCGKMLQAINNANEIISVGTATATYTAAAGQFPVTAANASAACDNATNNVTWVLP